MITFEMFARPAILKMMGRKNLAMPSVEACLMDSVKNTDGRRVFLRVRVSKKEGQLVARVTGAQGSGILPRWPAPTVWLSFEDVKEVHRGDAVEVMMPDWNEEQS